MRHLRNIFNLGIKELRSLLGDKAMLTLIVFSFTVSVYSSATVTPGSLNLAPIAIADMDQSQLSNRIVNSFYRPWFLPPEMITADEMDAGLDAGRYTFAINIPPNFQRDVLAGRQPDIQVNVDATRMSQAFTGNGYIQNIINGEVNSFVARYRDNSEPLVSLETRMRFNPNLDPAWFGGVMAIINNITMLAIVLTGSALIREREHGTVEHLLVMPITPFEIMMAKVWSMGLVVLVVSGLSLVLMVKGVGLVMLVLIGVAPAGFVVNMNATGYEITRTRDAINNVEAYFEQHPALLKQATGADQLVPAPEAGATQPAEFHCHPSNTINALNRLKGMLTTDVESYDKLSLDQRSQMRRIMLCVSDTIDKVVKMPGVSADDQRLLKKLKSDMLSTIEYAPVWIIMAVALALGIGTMIGWRRVATTIGEKIGKKGMTYAQGMSAQMTAAVSIGLASYTGMPVSTTHVLSSSVAGTMVVDGGGLQRKTVTSILMAWVFTLPAAVLLSGGLYWLSLQFL